MIGPASIAFGGVGMNLGGTAQRRDGGDDANRGDAVQNRLSQLAARLERLATVSGVEEAVTGEPSPTVVRSRQTDPSEDSAPSDRAPPAWDDSEDADSRGEIEAQPDDEPVPPVMADIAAALRDLDREPAKIERDRPLPVDQAPVQDSETRLAAIRRRIDALKSRRDDATVRSVKSEPTKPSGAGKSAKGPSDKSNGGPVGPPSDDSSERKPSSAPPAKTFQPASQRRAPEDSPGGDDLAKALSVLVEQPSPQIEPAKDARTARDIADLGRQLDELQRMIRSNAADADMSALEAGQSVIMDRVEHLMRERPGDDFGTVTKQILERIPSSERIDTISVELDRLSERVASLDYRKELGRIETRLSAFEEKLSATPERSDGDASGTQQLESSISAVRDSVEGLSRMLHDDGTPALARLEERLNQVSAKFEATLENAPRADSVADLFERLETLASRGEAAPPAIEALTKEIADIRAREHSELASLGANIQTLAERLDDAIGGKTFEVKSHDELEWRLASLLQRVDELGDADATTDNTSEIRQIEDQVAELSGRIDQLGASEQSSDGLAALERQVGDLMKRLDLLSADHDSLRLVQEHLAKLETVIARSGEDTPEALQEAARNAVRELSNLGGTQRTATLDALKSDLRELQQAAQDNDRQTGRTLDDVNQTLDRVVGRLSDLEQEMRGRSSKTPGPSETGPTSSGDESDRQRKSTDSGTPIPPDRPLGPDARRPQVSPKFEDRERRADFIAAARRAAQAAASEHAMQRSSGQDAEQDFRADRPQNRLRQLIGDHRRPLIIAAGAVALTIAVLMVVQPFGGADVQGESNAPAGVVDPSPEAAAPGPDAFLVDPAPDFAPAVADPAVARAVPPIATPPPEDFAVATPPAGDLAVTYPMPDEAVGSLRLRTAASSGDSSALYEVGARYADGRFVARNLEEAAIWFKRAAENGLAVAQHRLASLYEAGIGVAEDREAAHRWYLAAAEQGNVMAMHNLAVLLSQGVDGTPDFAGAIEWFIAGAEHGIRDSQYNLGVIYARGIGAEVDLLAAYQWFAIAAAQGDTDAAARHDDVAATLSADQLAVARAAVAAWEVAGAAAEANTVAVPEGGWDPPDERVETNDRDRLVRTIQALLIERGYDPGPADGVEGPMTYDAVRAFQAAIGLEPTGQINEELLVALTDLAA